MPHLSHKLNSTLTYPQTPGMPEAGRGGGGGAPFLDIRLKKVKILIAVNSCLGLRQGWPKRAERLRFFTAALRTKLVDRVGYGISHP